MIGWVIMFISCLGERVLFMPYLNNRDLAKRHRHSDLRGSGQQRLHSTRALSLCSAHRVLVARKVMDSQTIALTRRGASHTRHPSLLDDTRVTEVRLMRALPLPLSGSCHIISAAPPETATGPAARLTTVRAMRPRPPTGCVSFEPARNLLPHSSRQMAQLRFAVPLKRSPPKPFSRHSRRT